MTETIYALGGVVAGWWLHGTFDRIAVGFFVRVVASHLGKRAILEALEDGLAKLERRR